MKKNQMSKIVLMGLSTGLLMSAQGQAVETNHQLIVSKLLAAGCGASTRTKSNTLTSDLNSQNPTTQHLMNTDLNTPNANLNRSDTTISNDLNNDSSKGNYYSEDNVQMRNDADQKWHNSNKQWRNDNSWANFDEDQLNGQWRSDEDSNNSDWGSSSVYQRSPASCGNINRDRGEYSEASDEVRSNDQSLRADQSNQINSDNILSESELLSQLNDQGKEQYKNLDTKGKLLARKLAAQSGYKDKNLAIKEAVKQMSQQKIPNNN